MASLGFANIYAMRVNLSVAIVAMVGGGGKFENFPGFLKRYVVGYNFIILVANQTVGTECPAGNNTNPDHSDVGAVIHKQDKHF